MEHNKHLMEVPDDAGSGVKNLSLGHPPAGSVSSPPRKSTMAWGSATV